MKASLSVNISLFCRSVNANSGSRKLILKHVTKTKHFKLIRFWFVNDFIRSLKNIKIEILCQANELNSECQNRSYVMFALEYNIWREHTRHTHISLQLLCLVSLGVLTPQCCHLWTRSVPRWLVRGGAWRAARLPARKGQRRPPYCSGVRPPPHTLHSHNGVKIIAERISQSTPLN